MLRLPLQQAHNVQARRNNEKESKPFKVKWVYQCFGISKQAYYKRLESYSSKVTDENILKIMVKTIGKKWGKEPGESSSIMSCAVSLQTTE
ncbi:MAG: hypothetical protein DRJ09_01660 [Bacteroidetes bacterium]|nr:MAG: hypothetical protein DRJ09_01660 [Bacteroidota bacterium]